MTVNASVGYPLKTTVARNWLHCHATFLGIAGVMKLGLPVVPAFDSPTRLPFLPQIRAIKCSSMSAANSLGFASANLARTRSHRNKKFPFSSRYP